MSRRIWGVPYAKWVCVLRKQLPETVERAKAARSSEKFFGGVLTGLCKGRKVASLERCLGERTGVSGVLVSDRDVPMVLMKLGFISKGFCYSLEDYDRALNVAKASRAAQCVEHEHIDYANSEFEAQRKMSDSFVRLREERDGREEV